MDFSLERLHEYFGENKFLIKTMYLLGGKIAFIECIQIEFGDLILLSCQEDTINMDCEELKSMMIKLQPSDKLNEQLERLNSNIVIHNYSIAMIHDECLFIKNKAYKIENYSDTQKTILISTSLSYFMKNTTIVFETMIDMKSSIYKMSFKIQKSYESEMKMLSDQLTKYFKTIEQLKVQGEAERRYSEKYINLVTKIVKKEKELLKQLTTAQNSSQTKAIETELDALYNTKDKTINKIIETKKKRDDLLLSVDSFLFDGIQSLNAIKENYKKLTV